MIFVDMDGVLCDFITAAFSAHGQRFNPKDYPRGEFACEKILGITTNEFWRRVDFGGEAFWENLEPYLWALDLVKELQQIDQVIIATSPSRSRHRRRTGASSRISASSTPAARAIC